MPAALRPLRLLGVGLAAGATALALLPFGQASAVDRIDAPRKATSCTHVSSGYLCLELAEVDGRGTVAVTYRRAAGQPSRDGSLLYSHAQAPKAATGTAQESGAPKVVSSPDVTTFEAGRVHEFRTSTPLRSGCYRAGVVEEGGTAEWGGHICV